MKVSKEVFIVALSPVGDGLSGGDRIFIEFARNLSKTRKVKIATWHDGMEMCKRNGLDESKVRFVKIKIPGLIRNNFFICYIYRIIAGIWWSLSYSLSKRESIIYSASEFLMDVYPSIILKKRNKGSKLICTWFQTAPNPVSGYTEGDRKDKYRFNAFLYWMSQRLTKPFINFFSDYIIVNNEDEKKRFPNHNKRNKLFVVLGGVDVERINNWKKKHISKLKKYDAVFQGRFHAQKGVTELIDIWKYVVANIPTAKLAMIGDGPLMASVLNKVKKNNLTSNVDLLGYVFDGDKKYKIFQSSKVVLHPAFYDSGGMASAEAMIFGIPVVGFDLVSYKSYYPKGMVKVKIGDLKGFARITIDLLKNKEKRLEIGKEAQDLIEKNLSWSKKTQNIFSKI